MSSKSYPVNEPRIYDDHWQKPEWIYDQVIKIEKKRESEEYKALKERNRSGFYQRLANEHIDLFQHYTKIFYRCADNTLSKQLLLMLLKQRQKMDNGELTFDEGNNEIIGASTNLMLRGIKDDELKEKISKTYVDLVKEQQELKRKAIREYLEENGQLAPENQLTEEEKEAEVAQQKKDTNDDLMKRVQEMADTIGRAPQSRVEIIDVKSKLDQDLEEIAK